jgi:hypothetical protein
VDATNFTVTGTAVPGYTVRIYFDDDLDGTAEASDNNGQLDAGEPLVATTTAAADGTWLVVVPLIQNSPNNFIATQRSSPLAADGPYTDVPTITQAPSIPPEAGLGGSGGVVEAVDKVNDWFAAGGEAYFYDSNDLFAIGGIPATIADFEAALSSGDTVQAVYADEPADQSSFNLTDLP